MKIAIVDDHLTEAAALQQLIRDLLKEQYSEDAKVSVFTGTENFMSSWTSGQFDLILLDIFIDARTGIDLANYIRRTDSVTKLVFCSTSNEFAAESYDVNAAYYLTKPVKREHIQKMLHRIMPTKNHAAAMPSIHLPDGKELFPGLILYTEYYNHVVTIYFKQGYTHVLRISQTELEQLLKEFPFFYSPIRGILINLREVIQQTADAFCMSDGKHIPIARRKRKEAAEEYTSFRFQTLIEELND